MELSNLWQLPLKAFLDGTATRDRPRESDRRDGLALAWGPVPRITMFAVAVAAGVAAAFWTGPSIPLVPGPVPAFALLAAWRSRAAFREIGADDVALRNLLATTFAAVAVSVTAAFATRALATGQELAWVGIPELVGDWAIAVAVGCVLTVALATTRDAFSALWETLFVLLGFWIMVWVTRFVAQFATLGLRIVIGIVMGMIGLDVPAWIETWAGVLSDAAFTCAVGVYIVAACWLTAVDVVPGMARGEERDFAGALGEILEGDEAAPQEASSTGER